MNYVQSNVLLIYFGKSMQSCFSPVRGWVQRAGEGAGCQSGYWRAGADGLHPSGGRRTVELHRKKQIISVKIMFFCRHFTVNIL